MTNEISDIQVKVQSTPNPNAYKFIVNREVKAKGNVTYDSPEECTSNKLAKALFSVDGVKQMYFFENVITVTISEGMDVLAIENKIISIIKEKISGHDPHFSVVGTEEADRRAALPEELRKIEEILDRTIRPYLQGDGGDLEVVSLNQEVLKVRYQGACGTCPSSTMGTLMAIEGVLKDQFDPDIQVMAV